MPRVLPWLRIRHPVRALLVVGPAVLPDQPLPDRLTAMPAAGLANLGPLLDAPWLPDHNRPPGWFAVRRRLVGHGAVPRLLGRSARAGGHPPGIDRTLAGLLVLPLASDLGCHRSSRARSYRSQLKRLLR